MHQLGARSQRLSHCGGIAEKTLRQLDATCFVCALCFQNCVRITTDVVDDLDAVPKGGGGKSIENDDGVVDAIALTAQPFVG